MESESEESELTRLREEQRETRHDEIFGGLSLAERATYQSRATRIDELQRHLSHIKRNSPVPFETVAS